MPFLNVEAETAIELLDNPKIIRDLIHNERINPTEATLLQILADYSQTQSSESEERIRSICNEYFGEEADRSFQRLIKFAINKGGVSWVLFSRTTQFLPYDEKNALDDYQPRRIEVLIIHTQQFIELPESR